MKGKFPADFIWGTAISAFQTEYGPGVDIPDTDWYRWATSEEIIQEGLVSGDSPADGDSFWTLYREDMQRAADLGTNSIRLSIEWARIFPESTEGVKVREQRSAGGHILDVDVDGSALEQLDRIADVKSLNHYEEMLRYAKSLGLKIFLTLYHWPLPSWIHDPIGCHKDHETAEKKGWLAEGTIVEFGKYAEYVSKKLGAYVDYWETINEPDAISSQGYFFGDSAGYPPGISDLQLAVSVQKNLVFAHNVAYSRIKSNSGSPVGIGISPPWFEAADSRPETTGVAELARYMNSEWMLNALVSGLFDNDFDTEPDEMVEGISGTDFIGIDYYTRMRIRYNEEEPLGMEFLPCTDCTDFGWEIYPEGLRKVCAWIYEKYGLPLYILENGIADASDTKRENYITGHISELWKTISIDGIPVKGYFHWSLIDNFEWAVGYSMRFGLFEVDYRTGRRSKRKSADIYGKICRTGEIEYEH